MNEGQGTGYTRIEVNRPARSEQAEPTGPPPDLHNYVYITLFLAGLTVLLPFNSFIMAVDYFQQHYPDSSIMFDLSTIYITSACVAVVISNLIVDVFSYNTRIVFGILTSLITLIFMTICNIGWDGFTNEVSYDVSLAVVALVAFGSTIQQSSYYGFTGCLPPRYTQAVMAGESAAGLWVSVDRIVTKYTFSESKQSTIWFFTFCILLLLLHILRHRIMMRHDMVQYYLKLTNESRQRRRIQLHLNPNEDVTLMESEVGEPNYGVLKIQSPAPSNLATGGAGDSETTAFSFANPVYSPTATVPGPLTSPPPTISEPLTSPSCLRTPRTSYKVEDVVFESSDGLPSWSNVKRSVLARWAVARAIYPYMVSIGLVYFTTLSLYPGIASEVVSCRLGSWMPVVLMTAFNFFDLMGKVNSYRHGHPRAMLMRQLNPIDCVQPLDSYALRSNIVKDRRAILAGTLPYEWSRSQLLMASGVRLLLVPLVLLCAAPRHSPHIVGDVYPIMFSVILGFTNGLFGSIPMVMAPSRVGRDHREIAGNMMTLSYNGGLLSGTLVSYLLLGMLGPAGNGPRCLTYATPHLPTVAPITTASPNITFTATVSH